jgi:excisionase family DNA binding protein
MMDARPRGLTRADLLTPDEVAELLAVPRKTILRWAAGAYLPGHKIGRRWRFIRDELDQWVVNDATRSQPAA